MEYYGDHGWYCDPNDPASIRTAVIAASESPATNDLRNMIATTYNWKRAASETLSAYETVLKED
jgi:glycosyltransferase involved in cell wall biosynthesis